MKKIILICLVCFSVHLHTFAMDVSAKSACLISADTKEIIFSKNEKEKMPMASTTKIITGLLAAESGRLSESVTVSENAQNQEGSSLYLRSGEQIVLRDLLNGLMLNSGNDAAVAIAEFLSEDVDAFCEKMTERAKQAGAENTEFKNPNGLEADGHYTTAYDLALIGAEAMKNNVFAETVSKRNANAETLDGKILYFSNHNKLLRQYDGAVGIKTGFTKAAGRCLVSAAERDGIMLIAVTLNAPNDWNDHKAMLDYGFEKIYSKKIIDKGKVLKSINKNNTVYTFSAAEDVSAGTISDDGFEIKIFMPQNLPAPISAGEKAGMAKVYKNGLFVKQTDILSDYDIKSGIDFEKKSFRELLKKVFTGFI